ncbi:hypothetical protein K502DRAFT_344852 [Neoconidiobolus thromboides FSU 785]|nr:hypothetical protein K502DRAFT_344852 [Neoconidiobolus thromboides FSU 785]
MKAGFYLCSLLASIILAEPIASLKLPSGNGASSQALTLSEMRLNNNNSPGVLSYLRPSSKAPKEDEKEDFLNDRLDSGDEKEGQTTEESGSSDKGKIKSKFLNLKDRVPRPLAPGKLIKRFVEKFPPEKLEAYLAGDFDLPFRGIDPVKSRLVTTILFKYIRQFHIHMVDARLSLIYLATYGPMNYALDGVVRGLIPVASVLKPGMLKYSDFLKENPTFSNYLRVILGYYDGLEKGVFGEMARHYLRRIKKRNETTYNLLIGEFDHIQESTHIFPEHLLNGILHPASDVEEKDKESEKAVEEKIKRGKTKSIFKKFLVIGKERGNKESEKKETIDKEIEKKEGNDKYAGKKEVQKSDSKIEEEDTI